MKYGFIWIWFIVCSLISGTLLFGWQTQTQVNHIIIMDFALVFLIVITDFKTLLEKGQIK